MPSDFLYISNKFTRDERMVFYKMAGEGFNVDEITKQYNSTHPNGTRKVRTPGIQKILAMPEAHRYIAKFRLEFLKTLKDIPISEKKVRLDDLERLRQRLMHLVVNCQVDKNHPKDIALFMAVARRIIEITELARNEMEQHPGLSIGIGLSQGDLSDLTDEQLRDQRDELLRRAGAALNRRTSAVDENAEGNEGANEGGPAPVFLAPSEKLPGVGPVPGSGDKLPDVRQQEGGDPRLPTV